MARPRDPYTQEQIDIAFTALIAYAGNAEAACRYLRSVGERAPSSRQLMDWARTNHWERFEKLREEYAGRMEGTLANNMLDAARYATDTMMLATSKARERLEAGDDEDPGRTAANLSRVAQSATDKRLALQGRPTTITENRNLGEILRSLAARGVIALPEQVDAGQDE